MILLLLILFILMKMKRSNQSSSLKSLSRWLELKISMTELRRLRVKSSNCFKTLTSNLGWRLLKITRSKSKRQYDTKPAQSASNRCLSKTGKSIFGLSCLMTNTGQPKRMIFERNQTLDNLMSRSQTCSPIFKPTDLTFTVRTYPCRKWMRWSQFKKILSWFGTESRVL